MSAFTQAFNPLADRRHSVLATPALVVSFWAMAALLVVLAHRTFGPVSVVACAVAKAAAIFISGFAYMRLAARRASVDRALLAGVAWLVLSIAAEVVMTIQTGRNWFDLLGSPANPAIRDVLLFSWVAAPAVFARYRG